MTETYTRPDPIQEKKISEYSRDMNNFVADKELTVTITLNEYRDLISKVATSREAINEANKDKYTRENENKALNDSIAKLKAENYELQKRVNDLLAMLADEEPSDE